jgi:hypothetical protein
VRELSLEDQRIKQLEGRNLDGYNDSDIRTYRAVLDDYKRGVVSHPGKRLAIFYYNGFRVTSPLEFGSFPLFDYKDEWPEKYGIGEKFGQSRRDFYCSNIVQRLGPSTKMFIGSRRTTSSVLCISSHSAALQHMV